MKYLIFLLLTSSVLSLSAQNAGTNLNLLNSFVGEYEGYSNHSSTGDTSSAQWFEHTLILSYASPTTVSINGCWPDNQKICEDSILMSEWFEDTICEIADSLFNNEFGNFNYMGGFAKLYPDSTIELWYEEPPTCQSWWIYFKGKKTKSYAGINSNTFNKSSVKLYPNPAGSQLTVELKNYNTLHNATLELISINGKSVLTKTLTASKTQLKTSNLSNGIYLLKIEMDKGILTRKIIVEH